jgi:hypothetical protein
MQLANGPEVAVKCTSIDSADPEAILNEGLLFQRVMNWPHPCVVQVLGLCTDAPDGALRLVMKYYERGDLNDVLVAARPLVSAPLTAADRSTLHCS